MILLKRINDVFGRLVISLLFMTTAVSAKTIFGDYTEWFYNTGNAPKQSGYGTVDTCLFNRWEFKEENANQFEGYFYCMDIQSQTTPYRFYAGVFTRAQKLAAMNNPKHSAGNIWSVKFHLKDTPKNGTTGLNEQSLHRFGRTPYGLKALDISHLMTLAEYEREYGAVKLMRPKQLDDVMAGFLGQKATPLLQQNPPLQSYNIGKGITVHRWIEGLQQGDKKYKCNQELYANEKDVFIAFYHDCGWGKIGEVPLTTPEGKSPPPPPLTPEALSTRVKSPVDAHGIVR